MRCPKSRFPIQIIVFDELDLIIFVSQGLNLSTASLVVHIHIPHYHICRYIKSFQFKGTSLWEKSRILEWLNNSEQFSRGLWRVIDFGLRVLIKDPRESIFGRILICWNSNCQARVQVPNPLSQQVQNPDSKVRPSLKNPKTQFFGLGLTQ